MALFASCSYLRRVWRPSTLWRLVRASTSTPVCKRRSCRGCGCTFCITKCACCSFSISLLLLVCHMQYLLSRAKNAVVIVLRVLEETRLWPRNPLLLLGVSSVAYRAVLPSAVGTRYCCLRLCATRYAREHVSVLKTRHANLLCGITSRRSRLYI